MSVSGRAIFSAEDVFDVGLSDHLPQSFDVVHEAFPTGIALLSWNVMGRCISWSKRQATVAGTPSSDGDVVPVTNNGLDLDEEIHEYEGRITNRMAQAVGGWIAARRPPQVWIVCLQEAPAHPGILTSALSAISSAAGLARDRLQHSKLRETASTSIVTLWDGKMWDEKLSACMGKLCLCSVLAERKPNGATARVLNCHLPLVGPKEHDEAYKESQEPLRPPQEVVRELLAKTPRGQLALAIGDLNVDVRQVHALTPAPDLHVMSCSVPNSTIYQGTLLTSDALLIAPGQAEQGESLIAIPEFYHGPLAGLDRESYIQRNIHHKLQARIRTLIALSDADLELLGAHHFSDQPVKLQEWLRSNGLGANTLAANTSVTPSLPGDMFGKAGRQAYLQKSVHRRLQARAGKLADRELWSLGQIHFKDQFNEIDRLIAAKGHEPESNEDATRRLMGLQPCIPPFACGFHSAQQMPGSATVVESQVNSPEADVLWEAPPCADEIEWSEGDSHNLKAVRERVSGLTAWMQDLNLSEYVNAACAWCEDMGAITLEEVRENASDLSDYLQLKPLQRRRLLRAAEDCL